MGASTSATLSGSGTPGSRNVSLPHSVCEVSRRALEVSPAARLVDADLQPRAADQHRLDDYLPRLGDVPGQAVRSSRHMLERSRGGTPLDLWRNLLDSADAHCRRRYRERRTERGT